MRRVLASPTALGLVLAGLVITLVTGCGGSDKPSPVPAKTWVGHVCQALSPWRTRITDLNAQAGKHMTASSTPAQARVDLLAMLDGARQASEDARVKVAAAGAPDVPDGAAIAQRFVAALAAVRDAYGKARDTVAGLPTTDAKTFSDGASAAIETLTKEYTQAGLDTSGLASATLRQDFAEVPECG